MTCGCVWVPHACVPCVCSVYRGNVCVCVRACEFVSVCVCVCVCECKHVCQMCHVNCV